MGNSPLAVYTRLSPHCAPRTAKIDRITIHHMAGVGSVETCGAQFVTERVASSNYGIGNDGRVGLYVPEDKRACTSSSTANDNRAVTIEVSNSEALYPWPVSKAAYRALIELCADICKRNGIERLNYTGDTTGNLTAHRWFVATQCPGDYLYERFPAIAEEVNKKLKEDVLDMSKEELKKLIRESVKEVLDEENPMVKDLADVPDYWKETAVQLLDTGVVNGGTPKEENATDLNLRFETLKAIVVATLYHNAREREHAE